MNALHVGRQTEYTASLIAVDVQFIQLITVHIIVVMIIRNIESGKKQIQRKNARNMPVK